MLTCDSNVYCVVWIVPQRRFPFPHPLCWGSLIFVTIDRPIESIDSSDSIIFCSFENFWKDRLRRDDRFRQKTSKCEPSSRFFGRLKNFANFDSIDSIFRSIRSILRPRATVDRPAGALISDETNAKITFLANSGKVLLMENTNGQRQRLNNNEDNEHDDEDYHPCEVSLIQES